MGKISSGSLTVVDVKGGSDGINTATIYLYQRAATAPSKPSTNLTYTFATAKLTGGLGSWTQDIGTLTGSDPIWVIAAVASSNGTTDVIESTEWSEPIKMAQDGQDGQPGAPGQPGAKGLNQATVFIYKRDDSVEKPNSVTYTFATGSFTVPTGWSTSIPQSNGKPCWVCSAVAIGSDDTAQLSWTNPSVMVEDGSDGVSPVVTSTDNGVQIYDPVNDVTYTITNGADGTSYYTHILYSSKATPTSASDVSTSPTRKDYVGIQTTTSRTAPSWNDSGWQWMKYVGNDGTSVTVSSVKYAKSTTDSQPQDSSFNTALPTVGEGEWLWTMTTYSDGSKVYTKSKQGKSGTSVTVSKTEYQAGTSATTAPTGEWKTTIPSVAEGQYLWTKTTYSDGNYSYTVAKQGKSGTSITISSTSVKYQVGTSATTAPTGEWKDTVQSTTTGQYLWTRTIVTYSDGSDTTSYSVSAHGAAGTSVSISSIKYATSTTDSQPADSSFGTSIPTVSEGQWLWTMTTYSNGSKMYTKSKQGKSGVSVTKTRELYYLKTNSTNVPTITATSQITATDRVNGWTSIVPTYVANGTYYTCIETSLSVGGPVWSTPVENQGLTDANANAAESLSVSTHANENAQGALSISRATQQHFWFVPENTGSGASLIEAGAYITDTAIDTFKSGKNGGYLLARSDGLELGRGTNKFMTLSATALNFYRPGTNTIDATLTSKGLVLSKGGIEAGTKNTTNYIYIYSDDDATNHKLTINSHEASDWRIVAGKNFGVDKAGNLYASGANIEGKVTVTSGSNVYTTDEVNPLEIGGRNLIKYTKDYSGWSFSPKSGSYALSNLEDVPTNVMVFPSSSGMSSSTYQYILGGVSSAGIANRIKYSIIRNRDVVFSFKCKIASGSIAAILPQYEVYSAETGGTRSKYANTKFIVTGTGYWEKYSWKLRVEDSAFDKGSGTVDDTCWIRPSIWRSIDASDTDKAAEFQIKEIKIELGNKATDWTPAPEDVQNEIDAKKSTFTINATGTDASQSYAQILAWAEEGKQLTWAVDSTAGIKVGDTVRVKTTVSDMSNAPAYVVTTCRETPTSSTSIKTTSHGLDTTVIDGGKILTGSITANQLAANSITIGDMNQDAKDKVLNSNIQIGGKNLLGHTSNPTIPDINNSNPNATFGHIGTYNSPISEFSLESYDGASNSLVLTSTVTGNRGVGWYTKPGEVKAGETYTFSCRVNASVAVAVHMHTAWKNGSATDGYTGWTSQGSVTLAANTWTDYSFTFEPNDGAKLDWEFMVALCFTGNTSGVTCRIAHAKLERGNKATDWTPAPEDFVNDNILADSKKMAGWKTYAHSSISTTDTFGVGTLTGTTSDWSSNIESLPTISTSILDGTPLWLSFEYTASVDSSITINLAGSSNVEGSVTTARTKYSGNFGHTYPKTTTWLRTVVKMPTSLSALTNGSGNVNSLFIQFYNRTNNSTFQIRKVKLERGQYASDWTVSKDEYKTYITDIDSQKGITIKPAVKTGNDFLQINSSAVSIYRNNVEVTRIEDASARFGANANPHTTVNSTGLHVWKGAESTATNEVASFGSTARIGAKVASSSYIDLEPTAMTLYGTNASNQESPLFEVGNLLNETDEDRFIGDGAKKEFILTSRFTTGEPPNLVVKVNGTTKTKGTDYSYSYKNNYSYIIFTTAPAALADIRVSYTLPYSTPYFSMGTRKSGTTVKGQSFTMGKNCEASGNYSHAFGANSTASNYGASADGYNVTATGSYSHAEGYSTTASGANSHAEGQQNTASMGCSHAEGYSTTASGLDSHAEGYSTTASGSCSHAEGNKTTASGANSHAEGRDNIASGDLSHAQGCQTIAQGRCQTAIGKYNLAQGTANSISSTDYALIIGNGTSSNSRSNALTVNWNGQVKCRGVGALDDSYGSYREIYVGNYTTRAQQINSSLTMNNSDSDWLHAAVAAICQDYPTETWSIFKGRLAPNSDGFFQVCIYDCGEVNSIGTPKYCYGIWTKWWGGFGLFGTDNYAFKYITIH